MCANHRRLRHTIYYSANIFSLARYKFGLDKSYSGHLRFAVNHVRFPQYTINLNVANFITWKQI